MSLYAPPGGKASVHVCGEGERGGHTRVCMCVCTCV